MSDIVERLRQYNPPDRTIDEQRQMSVDIHEAADEITRLRAQVAALEVALGHMQHQRDEARRDHKNCSEVVRRLKAGEL